VFTVIHLTHYSPGQQMTETEQQYTWLEKELDKVSQTAGLAIKRFLLATLAHGSPMIMMNFNWCRPCTNVPSLYVRCCCLQVDRKKTPWLIVNWHGPW
jgi:hypothetical protein